MFITRMEWDGRKIYTTSFQDRKSATQRLIDIHRMELDSPLSSDEAVLDLLKTREVHNDLSSVLRNVEDSPFVFFALLGCSTMQVFMIDNLFSREKCIFTNVGGKPLYYCHGSRWSEDYRLSVRFAFTMEALKHIDDDQMPPSQRFVVER